MKRNLRKWIIFALSSALAVGAPISVMAEETGRNDVVDAGMSGEAVTLVRPEVYQVVLPTDVNGVFDFILDPQKLIEETNAAAYGGTSFEKGATMFFHRSDGQAAEEYSSSSDHVTIINRSNVPVEVQIDVNMLPESLGGLSMTEDRTFTNDDRAGIYLALTDGEYTVPVRTEGSFIRTTIPAAPENAFEYRYDQTQEQYIYGLKSDLSNVQFPEYSFQLTGTVNEKGDWKALGRVYPVVNVTWKVTPIHSVNPDEDKNPEQDNTDQNQQEQDLSPEQSMIIKQILETVPAETEKDEKGGDIGQENDSSREDESEQKENLDREEDLEQDKDLDQKGDINQEENPNQKKDLSQKEKKDQEEAIEQE